MKKLVITFLLWFSILITWCTTITTNPVDETDNLSGIILPEPEIQIDMTNKDEVIEYAIKALKEKNIDNLAKVTSEEWIRFSPYSYVDKDIHINLKKEELKEAIESEIDYVRGTEDGIGEPILMTFKNYFKRFVYDEDFQQLAEKNYDEYFQRWNTINNIEDIYPGTSTVEFFIPWLNPEYWWLDRQALNLVLKLENNQWKIRAIVHNEWTI